MGKVIITGGGAGADLDAVTAAASDVLSGKVIVGADGEPAAGTMPERGNLDKWMAVNETFNLPAGHYSGGQVRQSISVQGPDEDDRALGAVLGGWAGKPCLSVRNNNYLAGVNWIQAEVPEYQPWNIKRGVRIGNVIGTFEGYVPVAEDLYYRGNNPAGFIRVSGADFDAGQITLTTGDRIIRANLNFVGRSYFNVQGHSNFTTSLPSEIRVSVLSSHSTTFSGGPFYFRDYVASVPLGTYQVSGSATITFTNISGAIFRIWLS